MTIGVREIEEHRAALQEPFAVQRALTLASIETTLSITYRQIKASRGMLAESALLRRAWR